MRWMTVFLLAIADVAVASPTADLVSRMERSHGPSYLEARAEVVARGVVFELEARQAQSRYDRSSWKSDVYVDIAHFWMTRGSDAAAAYRLEGVDPLKYERRRRPEPEVARELIRLDAAPILFELLLETSDDSTEMTAAEKRAMTEGVLLALGQSKHPAAHWALLEVAVDVRQPVAHRALAARSLGLTSCGEGSPSGRHCGELPLIELLGDPSIDVRLGAAQGLGQVRTARSVEALRSMLSSENVDERIVAIRSLATLGSSRALRGREDAASVSSAVRTALIDLARGPRALEHADVWVEAISAAGDRTTIDELRALEIGSDQARRSLVNRAIRRLERRR